MAIGTPITLGTLASASPGASSYALTTTAAIVAADLVVVGFCYDGNTSLSVSSVTDTTGNTYARAVQSLSGTVVAEIWYCQNASAMASGNSITVNLSASAGGASPTICIFAARVTGAALGGAFDTSAHQEASTSTPSVTTAALAIADEVAIGIAHNQNTGPTYTESSGFTTLSSSTVNGQTRFSHRVVSATTAVTYAPSWSVSAVCRTAVATFRAKQTLSMTAAAGSYAVTGAPPSIGRLYKLIAAAGSYAITGAAITVRRVRVMVATAGSYAMTGAAATIGRAIRMAAGVGSYSITGFAANKLLKIKFAAGSYAIIGTNLIGAVFPGAPNLIRKTRFVLQKLRVTAPRLDQ